MRLLPVDIPADVVIRIRPEAYGAGFPELAADFDRAMIQLDRWYNNAAGRPSLPPDRSLPSPGEA
jgi:hypothetical protein